MDLPETATPAILEIGTGNAMNKKICLVECIFFSLATALTGQKTSDADSDCFYLRDTVHLNATYHPALLLLSCTSATMQDIDSFQNIADSLDTILAACHASRNHQNILLNDIAIMKTVEKLVTKYPVDASMIYLYGFSGQGVQAMMSLFKHPTTFKGIISVCGHSGAMSMAQWQALKDKHIYLISRLKDWNIEENKNMHHLFQLNGILDTLVITKGKHSPPTNKELLNACIWLMKIR